LVLFLGRVLSGETYFTTLVISVVASLTAVWLVLRQASTDVSVSAAAATAALSPLFLTYSTSGLEGPLVHVLTAAFVGTALAGRSLQALGGLAGLLVLTHWTTIFVTAPVLLSRAGSLRDVRRAFVLGAGPAVVWYFAAWWYYGTLGSTAHIAATADAASWSERLAAGASFFGDTARVDPLFMAVVLTGVVVGLAMPGVGRRLAIGSGLAIAWVVLSGGSVMAGRHLTAAFVIGLGLMARYISAGGRYTGFVAIAGVAFYALLAPATTLTSGAAFGRDAQPTARAHDPRVDDYQATGLLLESRPRRAPSDPSIAHALDSAIPGRPLAVVRLVGMIGAAAGPGIHVIDQQGRTDPLIARLPPAVGSQPRWGKVRRLPEGYVDGLPDGTRVEAPLEQLVGHIRAVTRGPLMASDRGAALFRLPRRAPELVAASSYGPLVVSLDALGDGVVVPEGGIEVQLPAARQVARFTAALTAGYDYRVELIRNGEVAAAAASRHVAWGSEAIAPRELVWPTAVDATAIRVRCGAGVGRCLAGRVALGD
jgi:arabinofuranosyltransferase